MPVALRGSTYQVTLGLWDGKNATCKKSVRYKNVDAN